MQDRKKLNQWLRKTLFNSRDGERTRKLVIRHITSAGKVGTEVASFDIETKSLTEDSYLETITLEIESACYDDAEGVGGVQKYTIVPLYGEKLEAAGRYVLRVSASGDDSEGEIDSEPATKQGLVTQLMRHNEALMRTSIMATGNIISQQNRVISRQADHIENMMAKHFDTTVELEGLMSQRHERDLEAKKAKFKMEQQKEIFDKVSLLLPTVVNKITGKKLLQEKVTPKDMQLRELLGSLTPAQQQAIGQILRPEQMIALGDLYNSEADAHNAEQESKLTSEKSKDDEFNGKSKENLQ